MSGAIFSSEGRRSELLYAGRLAWRELRGGVRGFGVFLACLALGVGTVAGIGSLTAAVVGGLRADARVLLGGEEWSARPFMDGQAFEPGTQVEVAEIRGATALVY